MPFKKPVFACHRRVEPDLPTRRIIGTTDLVIECFEQLDLRTRPEAPQPTAPITIADCSIQCERGLETFRKREDATADQRLARKSGRRSSITSVDSGDDVRAPPPDSRHRRRPSLENAPVGHFLFPLLPLPNSRSAQG